MPRTPVYNPEDEYYSQQESKAKTRKLGTGEPILLYINTGVGRYELVDRTFDSRIEADQYAQENYGDTPTKILSQSQALAESKKQEARAEKIAKIKERGIAGAKALGRGAVAGAKVVGRESVAALKRGVEKAGEYSEHRQERVEKAEERRELMEERQLEKEYRALEKERIALARDKLRSQRGVVTERESVRQQRQQPAPASGRTYAPQPVRGSFLNMPNIWAPTQRSTIVGPTSRGTINPPPPMTSKTPWLPRNMPPTVRVNMPNIWQRQYSRQAPKPRVRVKKQKPHKSKRRR